MSAPSGKKGGGAVGVDPMGRTSLLNAVIDRRTADVERLLQQGARADEADRAGWTALHFAARDYNIEMVKLLVQYGAPINAQDGHGNTPLFRAVFAANGRVELVRFLLASGADKNLKNKANNSALDLAERLGGDIAEALR